MLVLMGLDRRDFVAKLSAKAASTLASPSQINFDEPGGDRNKATEANAAAAPEKVNVNEPACEPDSVPAVPFGADGR